MHFLIVGAGFSGVVAAHQLGNAGHSCTIVDQRPHIAGNAYDSFDENGVLSHNYGPHYFRTNSQRIVDYLSEFTEWHPVKYQVTSHTQGRDWSFPINLKTYEQLIGAPATEEDFKKYLEENRHHIPDPQNSEEVILSKVGTKLYELFFEGYTLKQWNLHPRDLDPSVCGRIPIRTNRDDRYLSEEFQALPKDGYTALFQKIIAATPQLSVHLNTSFQEAKNKFDYDHIIFTGPIDEFYDRRFGALPYRSMRFESESLTPNQLKEHKSTSDKDGFYQSTMQVNFPDKEIPYTRIVEIKHATGQQTDCTNIVREFPETWSVEKDPYYPIPTPESASIYQKYRELAAAEKNVTFIGRLATYRYYNMDQVIGMALSTSSKLIRRFKDIQASPEN